MKEFDHLVDVIAKLRKKCPWDKTQTHKSLKPYMVEEVYEALEAIDSGEPAKLCEELGDALLHIIMHAEIARQAREFTIRDVISGITAKMVRRHPHVFGGRKTKKLSAIWEKWEEIKKEEKGEGEHGVLEGVPRALPRFTGRTRSSAARRASVSTGTRSPGPGAKCAKSRARSRNCSTVS